MTNARDKANNPQLNFTSKGIDDNADAVAITIDSSEKVGIGETAPLGKLHVKSADSGASAHASADELVIEGSANVGINILSGNSNEGGIYFGDDGDNDIGRIRYDHSANSLDFKVNASEALRIDSSGKVGIGTTSPANQLHVRGTGNGVVRFDGNTSSNTSTLLVSHNSAGDCGLQFNSNQLNMFAYGDIAFFPSTSNISGSYPNGQTVVFKNSGKVGIGTSSPATTLDVAGDTTITKNDTPLYLNRTSSGGEILRFSKDGTARGSIAVSSDGASFGNTTQHIAMHSGILFPSNDAHSALDNTIDLGYSGGRFKNIYLSGGAFIGGTGTANQLDDYEEGTFTPSYTSESGSFSNFNYDSLRNGYYTKTGNLVHVSGFIRTDGITVGSASSYLYLDGLPFAHINTANGTATGLNARSGSGDFSDKIPLTLEVVNNASKAGIGYRETAKSNQTSITVADMDVGSHTNKNSLYFSITYRTA